MTGTQHDAICSHPWMTEIEEVKVSGKLSAGISQLLSTDNKDTLQQLLPPRRPAESVRTHPKNKRKKASNEQKNMAHTRKKVKKAIGKVVRKKIRIYT